MERFCTSCGAIRSQSGNFCTSCGIRFGGNSEIIIADTDGFNEYSAPGEVKYERGLGYVGSSWLKSVAMIGLPLFLIASAFLIYYGFSTNLGGYGYVSASSLNCRSEPDSEAKVVDRLQQDTKVVYLDRQDGWAEIEAAQGRCWISEDFVSTELWRILGSRW